MADFWNTVLDINSLWVCWPVFRHVQRIFFKVDMCPHLQQALSFRPSDFSVRSVCSYDPFPYPASSFPLRFLLGQTADLMRPFSSVSSLILRAGYDDVTDYDNLVHPCLLDTLAHCIFVQFSDIFYSPLSFIREGVIWGWGGFTRRKSSFVQSFFVCRFLSGICPPRY